MIRPDPNFQKQLKVFIDGLVYYPGSYILKSPNEKISDIIIRAGGLRPNAYPLASKLVRGDSEVKLSFKELIKNPRSKHNFILFPGDEIFIGSKPNIVEINGEVSTPGSYSYKRGSRFKDYIKMAGGMTRNASKFSSYVIYPNGTTKKIKLLNMSPSVPDGSIIVVGKKEEVVPFNFTEYASNLTQIYADLLQAYLIIVATGR